MKIAETEIEFGNHKFILTNQRAVFLKVESALILSDLHVGKTAHFRKHGIAIPKDVLEKDLERLEVLTHHFKAKKIIVVGDMLHAGNNSDVDYFCEWRNNLKDVEFHLVEGNHDRISKTLSEKLCFTYCEKSLLLGDLCFVHDFEKDNEMFQITGHIHPGVVFRTPVNRIKLPCFAVTEKQLLLPAFSEFTGLDTKNTPKNSVFYAFTNDEIFRI